MTQIDVDPPDDESARLWASVGDLTELLPPTWVLIGGLMVQIHALEHGVEDVRATTDIDVLGPDRRARYARSMRPCARMASNRRCPISTVMRSATPATASSSTFLRPMASSRHPRSAPAEPQSACRVARRRLAVRRRSRFAWGSSTFTLRRPTLLGAILIKARSLVVHHDPESQREDLLLLLSLVEDPRAMASELKKSERGWLSDTEVPLSFDRPANVGTARLRLARLTLGMLLRER